MRQLLLLVIGLMFASCTTSQVLDEPPLQYSFLPKHFTLDSVKVKVNDDTNSVFDKTYSDFVSVAIDSGLLKTIHGDTLRLRPGVLISEKKAALYTFYKSSWERYRTEIEISNRLLDSYYDRAGEAEMLYQAEIVRLRKEVKRSWLEKNMGYIGFTGGVLAIILSNYVIFKAYR